MDLLIFALILLGILVLIMFLQYVNASRDDKLYLKNLNGEFGICDRSSYDTDRLNLAKGYHLRHRTERALDDITWSDLFMDDIFALIDRTESDAGTQMLYHLMRTPLYDESLIDERRRLIDYFTGESAIRNNILLYLHHAGRPVKESVYDLLDRLRELKAPSNTGYIVRIILLILSVVSMYFIKGIGAVLFVIILISNVYVYYRDRSRILPYLRVSAHILDLMDSAGQISECLKGADEPAVARMEQDIRDTLADLKSVRKEAFSVSGRGGANPLSMIFAIIGIFVYADIIGFWRLKDRIIEHEQDIDKLIGISGTIDAIISLAGYVKYLGEDVCIPEFTGEASKVYAADIYHPLIKDPVKNTLDTAKCMLLTGANASGKSTFLRSIGLCMLYSQTIGYVCASSYKAPLIRFMSAMSVHDDVTSGDSYYMAEIKAVKRMMDEFSLKTDEQGRILNVCFVDELLNGTNTEERIAACTGILKAMEAEDILVFAATHDIELTTLLSGIYDNYHFEEDLSEGDVKFSYKLKTGPATTRNAIRLLRNLGFDTSLVDEAQARVDRFEKDGIWS